MREAHGNGQSSPKMVTIHLAVRVDGGTLGHNGAQRMAKAAATAAENAIPERAVGEVTGTYSYGYVQGCGEVFTR